jgi:hypothetical protein
MEAIKVKAHVGDDGILKLELPVGVSNSDLEVVVVVQSVENGRPDFDRAEWIAFVERTYGSLADDPIEREDQGVFEIRDEIE